MKFVCDRCQTRYSIADEKVRMKILRIRCKTCGNVIVVQGEGARGDASGADGSQVVGKYGKAAPAAMRAAGSSLSKSRSASARGAVPPPPPPGSQESDPMGGRVEWYIAVGGVQSGPFSRMEAAKRIAAIGPGKTVHVWKEGMSGWKPSSEVSVIARELSLLRPPPPPPPPPVESLPPVKDTAKVSRTPAPAGLPSPSTLAKSEAKTVVASSDLKPDGDTASLFPGKPLTPAPQNVSAEDDDPSDIPTDPEFDAFAEITTKKAKKLPAIGVKASKGASGDATTKKGKDLKELESDPLFEAAETFAEEVKTPPPAEPLPSVGTRTPAPIRLPSSHGGSKPVSGRASHTPAPVKLPTPSPLTASPALAGSHVASSRKSTTPPPVSARSTSALSISSTNLPMPVVRSSLHQSAIDEVPAVTFDPPEASASAQSSGLGGLAAVMAAVSATPEPAVNDGTPRPAPILAADVAGASFPAMAGGEPKASGRFDVAGMFRRNPGLKFVIAVAVIVVLVILLVVVSLRGDGSKPSASETVPKPEPAKASSPEPAKTEQPAPPPVALQAAKPAQPAAGTVTEEKSISITPRSGGKRGGRTVRTAAPAPAAQKGATVRQPSKSSRTDVARPNPFDEARAVSQQQISAVVRSQANQYALKACYERALKMDNRLTSGRIDVTVSISASGAVQRVVVNAPASFIMVEPCIKTAVKRWVFPPNVEDYATNFPLIMQGGM
jgi:predicted Zn finger-like uncharacterized protein